MYNERLPSSYIRRGCVVSRQYISGRVFEYAVKNHFVALGYCAFRSAGSHSPFDVVCVPLKKDGGKVKLIQCKRVAASPKTTEGIGRLLSLIVDNAELWKFPQEHVECEVFIKLGRVVYWARDGVATKIVLRR
jgi:hypothetical protein